MPDAFRKSRPTPAHEGLPVTLAQNWKVSDCPAVTANDAERFTPPCAVPTRAAFVPPCASATIETVPEPLQPERSLSNPLLLRRPQVCANAAGDWKNTAQKASAKEIHFFVFIRTS